MDDLPDLAAINQLKALNKWVAWKYVDKGGPKPTKVPINPHTGNNASVNKSETWGSYQQAVDRAHRDGRPGVGFVLTKDDGITGADLDDVRDPVSSVLEPWAQEIVDLAETYCEISPSGTGLRFFWQGKIDQVIKKDKMSVEVYGHGRYLTITGNHHPDTPEGILPAPKTLKALMDRAGKKIEVAVQDVDAPEHILAAKAHGRGTAEARETLNKWQAVNQEALNRLDDWVPALFDNFIRTDDGRYRITSKALGRKLQEDLSISPEGIIDFGVADQGDPREGKRTAIELVIEYSQACKGMPEGPERYNKAYATLAKRLGHNVDEDEGDSSSKPNRIEVQLADGEIARTVDETQNALINLGRPVFVRGGTLVEPLWAEYPTKDNSKTKVTTFKAISHEGLGYIANKHGVAYTRWDAKSKAMKETDPPAKIMGTLLKLGHWKFKRVTGIINAPTMRPDGSILFEKGYDEQTQLWCDPALDLMMPEIDAKPTKREAAAALQLLLDLLSGFPMRADLDKSVAVAAILATVLRGAFDIAPMFLFIAHMAGTGKSYMVDVISTIVRGRPCPVITASKSEEEMEKRIGALLIESVPIVSLDNLSFDLKSDLLCQMCTQQTVKVRVLGKSETPDCEWKGTLFATGNNVNLSGDMTRRGLICNLDAKMERPETREFEFSPIDRVLADRGKYIAAALIIARAYYVSGTKAKCSKIGSYEAWSQFVREPLVWLGMEDPVRSMDQAFANDPNKEAAEQLIEQWREHLGTKESFKVSDIISKARETVPSATMGIGVSEYEHLHPDFFEVLTERCGERGNIEPRRVSQWFRYLKGQIYSGHKIVIATESERHGHRWRLESQGG